MSVRPTRHNLIAAMSRHSRHRSYDERQQRAAQVRWVIFVIVIAALFAAAYFLAKTGPNLVDEERAQPSATTPELEERWQSLRNQAEDLRQEFDQLAADGEVSLDDLRPLRRAIANLRTIVSERGADGLLSDEASSLEQLLTVYDLHMGEFIHTEVQQVRTRAETLRNQGNLAAATLLFEQAADLQKRLNNEHPRSPHADLLQESQLDQATEETRLRPLHQQSLELEARARQLRNEERLKEAMDALEQAVAIEQNLVDNHFGSPFTDLTRLRRLQSELEDVRAQVPVFEIERLLDRAAALQAEGDTTAALAHLEQAVAKQREVNRQFAGTTHASEQRLLQLETRYQSLASLESATAVRTGLETIAAQLREHDVRAAEALIASTARDLRQIDDAYPLSEHVSETMRERLAYLNGMRGRLEEIHAAVRGNLIPLDSSGRLFDREVPQALFDLVGDSPGASASPDNLPAASVTWHEAEAFCRRLSWILGSEVRLPSGQDFRRAVGEIDRGWIEAHAWHSRNSDRNAQPVATRAPSAAGFYDLIGNVAEWLDAPSSADDAPVAGGSARDNPVLLSAIPFESNPKSERNRFVGFRFIVRDDS